MLVRHQVLVNQVMHDLMKVLDLVRPDGGRDLFSASEMCFCIFMEFAAKIFLEKLGWRLELGFLVSVFAVEYFQIVGILAIVHALLRHPSFLPISAQG